MELETVAGWNGNWMRFLLLKRYIWKPRKSEDNFLKTRFSSRCENKRLMLNTQCATQCVCLQLLALVHLKIHDVFFFYLHLLYSRCYTVHPSFLASFPISIRFSSIYFHILLFSPFPSNEWNANEKLKVTK